MIVLRYLILTSNFNKIHLLVGLCLGPLGQLTALPRPLAGFKGPSHSRGRGGRGAWEGGKVGKGGKGKGRRRVKGGEGRGERRGNSWPYQS